MPAKASKALARKMTIVKCRSSFPTGNGLLRFGRSSPRRKQATADLFSDPGEGESCFCRGYGDRENNAVDEVSRGSIGLEFHHSSADMFEGEENTFKMCG